jgi:CheY-like chemotaxis protein
MKILVIHRQEEVVKQIKDVMPLSNQIVVRYCSTGLDGLLIGRVASFDLIICSTDLPMVTGYEVIRNVRSSSVNKNTPVIFLANEIDERANQLTNSLMVLGTLLMRDVGQQLLPMVEKHIQAKPDVQWGDLILQTGS